MKKTFSFPEVLIISIAFINAYAMLPILHLSSLIMCLIAHLKSRLEGYLRMCAFIHVYGGLKIAQIEIKLLQFNGLQADMLWLSCELDLIHLKEAVEELYVCSTEETSCRTNEINSKSGSLTKENVQKIIYLLHPKVKQTLLDCLRNNKFAFPASGEEDGSNIWLGKYVESMFPRPNDPGRNLGTEVVQSIKRVLAEAPAVGSPRSSLEPSPGPAPSTDLAPSPGHTAQVPDSIIPAASPKKPFFPPLSNRNKSLEPSANENSSISPGSGVQAEKKSNNNKTVIIAVAVTASVTFVIAVLLFLCCCRFSRTGSRVRRTDESPLLSLSLRDFSVGIIFFSLYIACVVYSCLAMFELLLILTQILSFRQFN